MKPNAARRRIFLSVDFDFFCRELEDWDWGHAERPVYQQMIWHTRSGYVEETSLEKYALPHPRDFWSKLTELGFRFDQCQTLNVADSHLWAAPDFLDLCPGRVSIVNFDAHHDMGYMPWKELKAKWLDQGKVDCSNWLLLLLSKLPQLTASCVYPQWKGDYEARDDRTKSWEKRGIKGRFQYGVYSEDYVKSLAGDVVGIFIARSGAWMPPWHDQAFVDFAMAGAALTGLPADVPFESQEKCNPLDLREFDLEAALAHERDVQKMRDDLMREHLAKKKAAGG